MFPLPHGAAWQTLFLICGFLLIEEIRSEARVVCYYTNWSVYRPGTAKFNPQNINPYLCTHLIYAFGGFTKDNTLKPFDKYQDIEQGGYAKFTGLKSYNKHLKTLLAIGGWNEGSSRFSPLVASPERRKQFIKNILKFLRQNHFDGLDLDWEYPAFRDGGKPRDKENYANFVEELRLEFDRESEKTGRPRLLLTMAVPAGIEYVEKGYNIPKLNKYLDWFNILSYDYHSAYEPSVNHHSPLRSLEEENEYNYDSELNIDYTIKYYLNAGADKDKLVLGIPTYGRSYSLVDEHNTDIGAPADGPGEQGDATREKGYLAYYEICQALREDPDWKVVQPNPNAMGPYAYKKNQWVGYDDIDIVKKKAAYVAENDLGGIMFWSIDNDDFRGTCHGKPYPLIEAGKQALLERLSSGDNEVPQSNRGKKPARSRSRQGSSSNRNKISDEPYLEKTTAAPKKRLSNRRRSSTTTTTTKAPVFISSTSSLYIGGRTTTPEPPTTPDPGTDFKCEEEGFFPHPRDCKKYFWCLDSGPSNLGIVAHQFTCPSGLYFNTAADSCDFSRNVLCKKSSTTTAKPTTTTTTSTTTATPKVTAATSRTSFIKYITTTTTTPDPELEYEEYDEDEQQSPQSRDSEEDPKVLKELIELIKRVGGLEELEKYLQVQEDASAENRNIKTGEVSTTPSSIKKSLYSRVLSRPNTLNTLRSRLGAGKAATSTSQSSIDEDDDDDGDDDDGGEQIDSHFKNKYSSVIRNSRPSPQNAGIEKLPEFEGFLKEKPKYVTITRTKPTQISPIDKENKYEVTEDNEEEDRDTALLIQRNDKPFTQSPTYVDIRRSRPATLSTASENSYQEQSTTSKTTYQSINRKKPTTESVEAVQKNNTPDSNTQRYKTIERSKSTTKSVEEDNVRHQDNNDSPVTVQFSDINHYTKTTNRPLDTTTTSPYRTYANIDRRTSSSTENSDFTTTISSTISSETVATIPSTSELTTPKQQPITTTTTSPPPSTISHISSPSPFTKVTDIPTQTPENVLTNNEINHHIENLLSTLTSLTTQSHQTSFTTGLDTTGYDMTSTLTNDKNTEQQKQQQTAQNNEVTLTIKNGEKDTVVENSNLNHSSDSKTNNNDDKLDSSLNVTHTNINLSNFNVDSKNHQILLNNDHNTDINYTIVTAITPSSTSTTTTTIRPNNTQKKTAGTRLTIRTTTTTQSPKLNNTNNDIDIIVSSPRPFGFPRRRTRPPIIRRIPTTSTTTTINQQIVDDTSSTTTSSSVTKKKIRNPSILTSSRPNSRRPVLSVRRRLTTTATSSNEAAAAAATTIILLDNTTPTTSQNGVTTSFYKYNRRTRPSSSSSTTTTNPNNDSAKPTRKTTTLSSSNDVSKTNGQKQYIRRKYNGRPYSSSSLSNRRSPTTTPSAEENVTEQPKTSNPLFRRRQTYSTTIASPTIGTSKKDALTSVTQPIITTYSPITDEIDQEAGSSIQDTKFTNNRYNQIGENLEDELVDAIKAISRAPIPKLTSSTTPKYLKKSTTITSSDDNIFENLTDIQPTTRRSTTVLVTTTTKKPRRPQKTSITKAPSSSATTSSQKISRRKSISISPDAIIKTEPFEKIRTREFSGRTYRPTNDYDYYDDEDVRIVGKSNSQVKVVLHGPGIIECLDQGNFPHPLSCRKFISCAKMETGGVVGWEYTCPKGLSYDPVGGICNWAAGLGCKE